MVRNRSAAVVVVAGQQLRTRSDDFRRWPSRDNVVGAANEETDDDYYFYKRVGRILRLPVQHPMGLTVFAYFFGGCSIRLGRLARPNVIKRVLSKFVSKNVKCYPCSAWSMFVFKRKISRLYLNVIRNAIFLNFDRNDVKRVEKLD